MATTLRAAIAAAVKSDSNRALKALKEAGIILNSDEESALKAGNLSAFTDRQLVDRFNAKVLGTLGINIAEYTPLAGKRSDNK